MYNPISAKRLLSCFLCWTQPIRKKNFTKKLTNQRMWIISIVNQFAFFFFWESEIFIGLFNSLFVARQGVRWEI